LACHWFSLDGGSIRHEIRMNLTELAARWGIEASYLDIQSHAMETVARKLCVDPVEDGKACALHRRRPCDIAAARRLQ